MSTINEILLANQASFLLNYNAPKISNSTKKELEALKINPATIQTESQAKKLIQQEKSAKKSEKNKEATPKNQNSSEQSILSELKQLAAKLGVSVSEKEPIENIFADLSSALTSKMVKARMSKDVDETEKYNSIAEQLAMLKGQYDSMQNMQSMLSASMNIMGNVNKISLGL